MTLLSLIIIVSMLFPGLSLAASQSAANLFVDLVLSKEGSEILKSMGRVPTRGDVLASAKRLDAKDLDLFPLHVSSGEMDPEDFSQKFWTALMR